MQELLRLCPIYNFVVGGTVLSISSREIEQSQGHIQISPATTHYLAPARGESKGTEEEKCMWVCGLSVYFNVTGTYRTKGDLNEEGEQHHIRRDARRGYRLYQNKDRYVAIRVSMITWKYRRRSAGSRLVILPAPIRLLVSRAGTWPESRLRYVWGRSIILILVEVMVLFKLSTWNLLNMLISMNCGLLLKLKLP